MSSLDASYMTRPGRPAGVTIVTILEIIIGIGDVIIGSVLLILALIAGVLVGGALASALFFIDFVVIGLGIFSLVLAYGLWTGKRWAWTLSVIGAIIGIILGVLVIAVNLAAGSGILESLSSSPREPLVPIILYGLILVFLCTRNVRAFFGQRYAPITQSLYPGPTVQQPYYPQSEAYSQPATRRPTACTNCGRPILPGANFCDRCGTRIR